MATHLTFRLIRRAASRQHHSLSEDVLTGLAMFGLAANGMCLAALERSLAEVVQRGRVAGR